MYFIELGVNENPMNFWIVGIDHELQLLPDPADMDKLRAQKDQLNSILTVGTPQREIRFIAEESKLGKPTIAMDLVAVPIPGTSPTLKVSDGTDAIGSEVMGKGALLIPCGAYSLRFSGEFFLAIQSSCLYYSGILTLRY
jgi:hypothetical protein